MSLFWCVQLILSAIAFIGFTYYTAKYDGVLTLGLVSLTLVLSLVPFFNVWMILYMAWNEWLNKLGGLFSKIVSMKIWERKK